MSNAANRLPASIRFLERDWLSSNNILMFDGDQACVFDTGYGKHAATTDRLISASLPENTRLTRIINTHLHSDHCGGNAVLVQRHRCRISVPQVCVESVNQWHEQARLHETMAQQCNRFPAHDGIAAGQIIHAGGLDWIALAAPGHDPTSLIFFNETHRLLISADALWENGFGVIFPEVYGESGFAEQAAVLTLIESLNPDIVMPGHGPVFDNVAAALQAARNRLAAFVESPERSHRNALKVMVKFLMLDREQLPYDELLQITSQARFFQNLTDLLGLGTTEKATDWALSQLLPRNELTREGDLIRNA